MSRGFSHQVRELPCPALPCFRLHFAGCWRVLAEGCDGVSTPSLPRPAPTTSSALHLPRAEPGFAPQSQRPLTAPEMVCLVRWPLEPGWVLLPSPSHPPRVSGTVVTCLVSAVRTLAPTCSVRRVRGPPIPPRRDAACGSAPSHVSPDRAAFPILPVTVSQRACSGDVTGVAKAPWSQARDPAAGPGGGLALTPTPLP